MTAEMFHDCEKTFLTVKKDSRSNNFETMKIYSFDSAIIKFTLLILSVVTRLYSIMLKTRAY